MLEGMDPIDEYADIIDSRQVIARIEWLESAAADAAEEGSDAEPLDDDETAELAALKALAAEGESYAEDWHFGATLIRESYFETYAEELADDIGAINGEMTWPLNHIDWEAAANDLAQDYSTVEFNGITYYVR